MEQKDAIVILGRGIFEDGELTLSSMLRVELAAKLYFAGVARYLIPSSKWCFTTTVIPKKTIADAMEEMLIKLSIPKENIIVENESYDTIGNFYFVKKYYWQIIGKKLSLSHRPII